MTTPARPLVSIVTPCLNGARYLPRCLASVRQQTYTNIEHLVMDGGSSDGTVELLESSAVTWVSEPDGGQTAAINKGWRLATGQVLTWLNADDYLFERAVESIVAALSRKENAGWVIGASHIEEGGGARDLPAPRNLSLRDLDESNPVVQPAAFVTRWAVERVGLLDESQDLAMDLDLWYRLLLAGIRPVTIPDVIAGVLIHPDTKTRSRPQEEYTTDFGLVRLKHGREVPGSIWLGRSAAISARASHGEGLAAIYRKLREVEKLASQRGFSVSASGLRAGALTEAAAGAGTPTRRLRYLAAPQPWRHAVTRKLILRAALARLTRRRSPGRARTYAAPSEKALGCE